MAKDYPLTKEEFDKIYSKVPRLTVEVIVKSDKGIALTLRNIPPCKGLWHLPGGTVYYGESIEKAVNRVAKREIGINVVSTDLIGYIEYPDHVASGYGDPRGLAILVTEYTGEVVVDDEADEIAWFTTVPEKMHLHQDDFLIEKGLLKPKKS